jgi:cysteine desulfurase
MSKFEHLIYFDNNATTPVDPRALNAMLPFLKYIFANAYSLHHFGIAVKEAVKTARIQVAELIVAEAFGSIRFSLVTYYTKEAVISATWSITRTVTNQYNHA